MDNANLQLEPEEEIDYIFPSVELLDVVSPPEEVDEEELKAVSELIRLKLVGFGIQIESVLVTPGPVITTYELVPSTGSEIGRIVSLHRDLALALKEKGERVAISGSGKGTATVEIPNSRRLLVSLREIINSSKFKDATGILPMAMGEMTSGAVFVDDLSRMPHLLIAGTAGSGKTVFIDALLTSLLYRVHPSDVKFILIDPTRLNLAVYGKLNHHFLAISPDIDEDIVTTPNNAVLMLKGVELEMEKRYERLAVAGVRNLADYNERLKQGRLHDTESLMHRKLPSMVLVITELADLMTATAREIEAPIAHLAKLGRAVGIHLVLATHRPSADILTGDIKADIPARVSFRTVSRLDSTTILDMNGAEELLGSGDMLFLPPDTRNTLRIQGPRVTLDEVERVVTHIAKQKGFSHPTTLPSVFEKPNGATAFDGVDRDELFEEAAKIVVRHQQGSVSLLQRRLKIGYSRTARLMDELEAGGIVGPFDGSKAREVLVETDAELDTILRSLR